MVIEWQCHSMMSTSKVRGYSLSEAVFSDFKVWRRYDKCFVSFLLLISILLSYCNCDVIGRK